VCVRNPVAERAWNRVVSPGLSLRGQDASRAWRLVRVCTARCHQFLHQPQSCWPGQRLLDRESHREETRAIHSASEQQTTPDTTPPLWCQFSPPACLVKQLADPAPSHPRAGRDERRSGNHAVVEHFGAQVAAFDVTLAEISCGRQPPSSRIPPSTLRQISRSWRFCAVVSWSSTSW